MKIEDIMTRNVQTCSPEDSLSTPAQIMWENDCGVVPVVDLEARVVGIITDRDVCMAAHLQGLPLHASKVSSAMARDVKCCSPQDTPALVQALMQRHKLRRLPVVDTNRRLLGVVSLGDLAYAMSSHQTSGSDGMTWNAIAHTLAAVSEPRIPRFPSFMTTNARTELPPPSSTPHAIWETMRRTSVY